MKRLFFILMVVPVFVNAQKLTTQEYIDKYKELAISEMRRSGVPADITLAQGVLETESGNSPLVKKSNNHFGIKCKDTWQGESVSHDDDAPGECFRKYPSAEDSYRDHSDFLRNRPYYAALFELDPTDYKAWAHGLKKAGYATNKDYAKILIRTIEEYELNDIAKSVAPDISSYKAPKEPAPVVAKIPATPKPVKKPAETSFRFPSKNPSSSKFNGLNAYYASAGTSVLAIAENYGLPLQSLLDYNDMKEDGLLKETRWIYLEEKLKEGKKEIYTTTSEEDVYDIAHNNAIQLQRLLEYNGWRVGDRIKPGTIVRLKSVVANRKSAGIQTSHQKSQVK
jgi:hypothetical protein